MTEDDSERKPAKYTLDCVEMLEEALAYLNEKSQKQADIMARKFFKIVRMLERMPEIGTRYKKGMRRFKLGKFRYNIYYRIKPNYISIVGIWHTSRDEFVEPSDE